MGILTPHVVFSSLKTEQNSNSEHCHHSINNVKVRGNQTRSAAEAAGEAGATGEEREFDLLGREDARLPSPRSASNLDLLGGEDARGTLLASEKSFRK